MTKENKYLTFFIGLLGILCICFLIFKLFFLFLVTLILESGLIYYLFAIIRDNKNALSKYKSSLRNILKTYDSILVEVNEIPSFKYHNIIVVTNFKDMVDAQYEIRKPIYFKEYSDSCAFILLDEKEVCIYLIKVGDDIMCPVEILLKDNLNKEQANFQEFFNSFEHTGIIDFGNNKSYKIIPIKNSSTSSNSNSNVTTEKNVTDNFRDISSIHRDSVNSSRNDSPNNLDDFTLPKMLVNDLKEDNLDFPSFKE